MIKALGSYHGKPLLLLGLSHLNLRNLAADRPIVLHTGALGMRPDIAVGIVSAPTEDDIAAQIISAHPGVKAFRDTRNATNQLLADLDRLGADGQRAASSMREVLDRLGMDYQ